MKTLFYRSTIVFFISIVLVFFTTQSFDSCRDEVYDSRIINAQPIPAFTISTNNPQLPYLQFIAVGDAGTGGNGQKEVAESMARKASQDSAVFVLVLGDNFYEAGVVSVSDPQWQTKFEKIYTHASLQIPFYAVLGNHDYRSNPQAQVEYTSTSTRWRMPDRYYTFARPIDDSTSIQFFCLDTNPLAKEDAADTTSISENSQVHWLEQQLKESKARWKIALGHHTMYSGGEHGDEADLVALLEPLFVKYKVDVYLCGHDHHQEMLKPIKGVHYIISGAGGKHRDVTWRENTVYAATNLGFTWFRASRNEFLVEFLTRIGTLEFAYTITK